jgi:RNA polymerase sigma-70 factor, ECF subfamily
VNDSRLPNRQKGETVPSMADPAPGSTRSDPIIEPLAARLAGPATDRATAFRTLLAGVLDDAYRRAAVLLGDRFEAEDAVHDAAEKAWRRWGDLRDLTRFEAWFGRILVNTCRDRLRSRRRVERIEVRDRAPHHEPGGSGGFEAADAADRMRRALAGLGADERIVVVLRFEADLTVPAIASLIGAPEGTVKSRLHHALRKLRATFEEDDR